MILIYYSSIIHLSKNYTSTKKGDGRIERPQGFVQRFQIGSHLPQHILVGVLLFPHALQQLPGLVQLAGVGDRIREL